MSYSLRYKPCLLKKRAFLSFLFIGCLTISGLRASDSPDHIFTTLDQLKRVSAEFSEVQTFHIYESNEGLGTPHNMDSLDCEDSEPQAPAQTLEASTLSQENGNGSFCEARPKRDKQLIGLYLEKEQNILGFVVSSPMGYWPSAPTLDDYFIDLGHNGTVIISYIKSYGGSHSLFRSNFLAFHSYSEDKKTENGYGFPLAINGTLRGENLQFIKNAVTLTTSHHRKGTHLFERESFYTPLEEPFEDESGNRLRFGIVRRGGDLYLTIHPLTENTISQNTQLARWAQTLNCLSFNRKLHARNQRLISTIVVSSSNVSSALVAHPVRSTRDLPYLLPLAPQIVSFARQCLRREDVMQSLPIPVRVLLREVLTDPLLLISEPRIYANTPLSAYDQLSSVLSRGTSTLTALASRARNWLSTNLPGFETAGDYFEAPVRAPSRQIAVKRELSNRQIVSLIDSQLSITPQFLDLSELSSVGDKHIEYLSSLRAAGELQMINLTGTSVTTKSIMALGKSRYVGRVRDATRSEITVLINNTPAAQEHEGEEPATGEPLYKIFLKKYSSRNFPLKIPFQV